MPARPALSDCQDCHGAGRVFDCASWPRCGCPGGTVAPFCPGRSLPCPSCTAFALSGLPFSARPTPEDLLRAHDGAADDDADDDLGIGPTPAWMIGMALAGWLLILGLTAAGLFQIAIWLVGG